MSKIFSVKGWLNCSMKISVGNLLSAISHLIDIAQGRREHAPKVT